MSPAHALLDPSLCVALYLRRSHRNAEGDLRNGRSLKEQESELRDLCARLGLVVVAVYVEREGTGASRHSHKARPEWEKALDHLHIGATFRTVGVWALDRADRRGAVQIGALLDAHADGSRRIIGVDGTDTGDPRRRLEHIIRAEIAREEADHLSERVGRAKRFARADGRWLGGPPPFGTSVVDGHLVRDLENYSIARLMIADPLLNGDSLWQVVKGLNTRKVKPVRAETWGIGTIAQLIRSPGWAGLQSIRERLPSGRWQATAEVFLGEDGLPVKVGEGVITPAERVRILKAVEARSESAGWRKRESVQVAMRGRKVSRSLLTEVLRCDLCDSRTARSGGKYKYYRCANYNNGKGCLGFSCPVPDADAAVSLSFLARVASLEPGDPLLEAVADAWVAKVSPDLLTERQAAQDSLDVARADLARVRRLVVAGTFDEQDAAETMPRLREAVQAAEGRLGALPLPEADISPLLDMAQSVPAWEALPLPERRSLLGLAIREVRATRADGRGLRFHPQDRLTIVWADGTKSPAYELVG
ncbi:recombinase family protein [Micromonospora sp. NBC_01699]|uniref:recombinase family protein n=1 Tax=Micromonospora sp. NBC_01699 TaxID=2975984 RepID=UPI002E2866D0|nr:recombinase family protein [Micromonospora sp. NBC_01699]